MSMKGATGVVFGILLARAVGLLAQAPTFSGSWQLDTDQSRIQEEAGLAGLIGAGAPATLHITHPKNGTLLVESQINESHARLYRPGGESSTPIFLGGAGRITMTTRWEEDTLVSEGKRETASGTSKAVTEVKEVFRLRRGGPTLEIEVTTTSAAGKSVSTLLFTRKRDVGPCESWPSPCKSP